MEEFMNNLSAEATEAEGVTVIDLAEVPSNDKSTKIIGGITTGLAIAGIVETTGLLVYGGLKLGKKIKAKLAEKKAAEAESNEDIPVAEEVKVDEE